MVKNSATNKTWGSATLPLLWMDGPMNKPCKECMSTSGSPCDKVKKFIEESELTPVNKEMLLYLMAQIHGNGGCSNFDKNKKYYELGKGYY